MSDVALTSAARRALLALVLIVDEASNPAIKERFGFPIDKPVREELEQLGLITSRKGAKQANFHELTEDGWRRGQDELAAEPPTGAMPLHRMLYAALNHINENMHRHGWKMADFFQLPSEPAAVSIEEQVLSACRELAEQPGDLVSLARVRAMLSSTDRKELDKVLIEMSRRREIQLEPEPNRQALNPETRKAALRLGRDDMHLIAIARR